MKAIIYHSVSKHHRSKNIALAIEGDHYEIESVKKPIKFVPFQMMYYGFLTVANRNAPIKPIEIDFLKYDEIVLVSPVWAGRANAYMRQFLKEHVFHDKKVTIIASCDGGYKKYFESFKGLIDGCNEIVEKIVYVKGELVS
jgi:hypothetical protein